MLERVVGDLEEEDECSLLENSLEMELLEGGNMYFLVSTGSGVDFEAGEYLSCSNGSQLSSCSVRLRLCL